jgi:hypothetical protein
MKKLLTFIYKHRELIIKIFEIIHLMHIAHIFFNL